MNQKGTYQAVKYMRPQKIKYIKPIKQPPLEKNDVCQTEC